MTGDLLSLLVERGRSRVPQDRIVTADEAAGWPDGALRHFIEDAVLEELLPATTAECDQCLEGHVELVQVVEEPPGSALRHYIACPEAGRVAIDPQRMRRWQVCVEAPPQLGGGESVARALNENPEALWPPTAAAFVAILRQVHRTETPTLRWHQVKERLALLELYPHRVRDVRRNVPNWDEVVESPRKGFYRLKAWHQTPT